MIAIIAGAVKTFEVMGSFEDPNPIEGKLYYRPSDNRLFYYTKSGTRSNPDTGYFPVWDGTQTYQSSFSNEKYYGKDTRPLDLDTLCASVDQKVADDIRHRQKRTDHQDLLKPEIVNSDNMFTQTIKGTICAMDVTIVDLVEMATPKLSQATVESFYTSLSKITLMRMDKWLVWLNTILHKGFTITVFHGTKKLVSYQYPMNQFDTGLVQYPEITEDPKSDFLKKLIRIVTIQENINKARLRSDETDEYTINNLMTSLNGNKPLSAQLFSRFMRMAGLSYEVIIEDGGCPVFTFRDQTFTNKEGGVQV